MSKEEKKVEPSVETTAPVVAAEAPKEKQIILSENEFSALMKRIEHLENPGIPVRQKHSKEHIGHLRTWEGQIVTRVGQVKEHYDIPQTNKNHLSIDLLVVSKDGVSFVTTVAYSDFFTYAGKAAIKFLEITKVERFETELEKGGGGRGNRAAIDAEGRATPRLTGDVIDFEVGYTDVSAKVEVTDGEYKGHQYEFTPLTINAINA